MTALVMTAIKGNTVLTRLLLSYGACIEIPDAQYSVLDAAIVTHRHYPSVRILIEGGADLYSTNPVSIKLFYLVTSLTVFGLLLARK